MTYKFQVRADDDSWATELYNSTSKISDAVHAQYVVVASGETDNFPIDVWFVAPKGKEFVHKENNSTDYVQIPFATQSNKLTKLYANGDHISYSSEDAYAVLSWDGTKYGGSYHLQITEKGVHSNLYFIREDDGSRTATCYPYLHMQESSTPVPKEYDVVYNLSNCTVSPKPDKMTDGTTYNLTVTPDSGYEIDDSGYVSENIPSIRYYDLDAQVQRGTYSNGVLTVTPRDVSGSITVTAKAVKSETPTPNEYDVVYNISNCSVSPKPDKMTDGTTYNLTFNLESGYKYDVGPKAVWQDGYAISHEGTLSGNVLTLTPTDVVGSIKVTATAIKDTPTTEYGTAKVYRVNDANMDSISEWAANQAETFDISKYIYTLRKFFFNVSAETDATIRFGRYDTKVAAKLVENDEFNIDCGTVSIEGVYNNAIDYDSDIEFYLPFVGPISIPANRVMDATVSLVYHVNVFNGDCVASICVNGIEVGRASGNISYEVPYTNSESYSKNIGTVQPQYLANLTPSVTISTPIAETTGVIGQRSIVTIGSLKGFAKFDNIQSLVIDGTKGEIDMIKSLLESGVYIA